MCFILTLALIGCAGSDAQPEEPAELGVPGEDINATGPPDENQTETPVDATPDGPDEPLPGETDGGALSWGGFPLSFTAQDLYKNTVTEENLGEKQLFFLHLWATWCPPCINEMPELAKLAGEYGDRVGFIALLVDYDSNLEGAISIAESAGIPDSFIMVDAGLPEMSDLLLLLQSGSVPTTVIVAPDGRMTEQMVGAYGAAYADILDMLLGSDEEG